MCDISFVVIYNNWRVFIKDAMTKNIIRTYAIIIKHFIKISLLLTFSEKNRVKKFYMQFLVYANNIFLVCTSVEDNAGYKYILLLYVIYMVFCMYSTIEFRKYIFVIFTLYSPPTYTLFFI